MTWEMAANKIRGIFRNIYASDLFFFFAALTAGYVLFVIVCNLILNFTFDALPTLFKLLNVTGIASNDY